MPRPVTVAVYLAGIDPGARPALNRLRTIVQAAHSGLDEIIKWNAPSFTCAGEDRVTLGLDGKGGLRIVLHRGAATKDVTGFAFTDDTGLAVWPAIDRGVVSLRDEADVAAKADAITRLVRRWIEATATAA